MTTVRKWVRSIFVHFFILATLSQVIASCTLNSSIKDLSGGGSSSNNSNQPIFPISIETKPDGSGQKLSTYYITSSSARNLYAVQYDSNNSVVGAILGTWSIVGGSNSASISGSATGSSIVLQGHSSGTVTLHFESSSDSQDITVIVEASPTVNFKYTNLNFEEYGFLELELEVSSAVNSDIYVNLSSSTGTAIAGAHFVAFPSSVIVPAGKTSYKFYSPVIRDFVRSPNKNFSLSLASSNGAILGAAITTNVQIADSDPNSVTTSVGQGALAFGENYTCWIKNSGLYCWGKNNVGQIGNGAF